MRHDVGALKALIGHRQSPCIVKCLGSGRNTQSWTTDMAVKFTLLVVKESCYFTLNTWTDSVFLVAFCFEDRAAVTATFDLEFHRGHG